MTTANLHFLIRPAVVGSVWRHLTGIFALAARDVLRSRRRTFTAILGVMLAITFIAGTFIAIDSSARATLDGLLPVYSSDISFDAPSGNASDVRRTLEALPGVLRVATFRPIADYLEVVSEGATTLDQVMGVDPDHPPIAFDSITIQEGSLALTRGTVALDQDLARILDVSLGDTITLRHRVCCNATDNWTMTWVNVTVGAVLSYRSTDAPYGDYRGPGPRRESAVVHLQDVEWYQEQLQAQGGSSLQGEIRVDRDRLIDPYDLDTSKRNLERLERQINDALSAFDGSVTFDTVRSVLDDFGNVLTFQRVIYLGLSAPIILLGLYLGAVGVDLGHAERRRELAVLKTRGAGRGQLLGLLLVEAALGGVIAAVIGLVAGIGLSRLLLAFVATPFGSAAGPRYDVLAFSASTVVTVVVLAVLFMAVTSFRSARRTANLPIVETLRYYAPGETRIHYRPTADIVLVTLAVATFGMVSYTRTQDPDFLTFLVGAIFTLLLPFAPIFLIIGSTRLLTRSSGRIYEWTSRVAKPFARNLYYVIARNLQRNPRRSANVAVIIALGVAFGMFILATFSSQLTYQERQVRAALGGDVAVGSPPSDSTFGTNLSQLSGVVGVTRVRTIWAQEPFGSAITFALDPASYFAVTSPEPFYFRGGGIAEAQEVLETPGEVLVTEAYLESAFLAVGDSVRLQTSVFNETTEDYEQVSITVTVGGTVRGLPGVSPSFGSAVHQTHPAIYGSFGTMGPLIDLTQTFSESRDTHYLIDLAPGADWRTVKDAILGLGASDVQVVEERLELLRSDPLFRAIFGFMQLEIAFMVVTLTAGLGLILYASTLERDVELAAIRARGASGWQTAGLLVGEAASITLIGLIIGAGIGTLTAYVAISLTSSGSGLGVGSLVPVIFTVPLEALILLALAPVAILATAFLVSIRVARMDVARVLKLRGG
jgi:ABC-type lipoprotein release transport system permease subunit